MREVFDQTIGRLTEPRPRCVGMSLGVVRGSEVEFHTYGSSGREGLSLHPDAIFEIGSITKAFTGILLADMASRGEVSPSDPVSGHLPGDVAPRWGDEVTLENLATHTAGLPRLPPNLLTSEGFDRSDPYAHFGEDQLFEALAQTDPESRAGDMPSYSNFGFCLLAYLLARTAGTTYGDLVSERISGPLGMPDTATALSDEQESRFVQGHDEFAEEAPHWNNALPGAGGIRSTARDLTRLIAANLSTETPLREVLAEARRPRVPEDPEHEIGLGWHLLRNGGSTYTWHNGGTGGFGSFLGFDMDAGSGIVVLTNSEHTPVIDKAAVRLLGHLGGSGVDPLH